MKIITQAIRKAMPPIGAHETASGADSVKAPLKLFNPTGIGTWYITEANFETGEAFGLCVLHEAEWGYVDLNELFESRGRAGLKIERDLHWEGTAADAMRIELGRGHTPFDIYAPRQEEQIATAVEHVLAADMPA